MGVFRRSNIAGDPSSLKSQKNIKKPQYIFSVFSAKKDVKTAGYPPEKGQYILFSESSNSKAAFKNMGVFPFLPFH
jgi:hypothetical protein